MNPLSKLDHFLSADGLNELRSKFIPPQGAYLIEYVEAEDSYHFCVFIEDTNEERTCTFSFAFLLKSELEQLLKTVREAIEARVFCIDSTMNRHDLVDTILAKLDQTISNWAQTPVSLKHSGITEVLREFRVQIESKLLPYTNTMPQQVKLEQETVTTLKLPKGKEKVDALDIRQSALLFHYLQRHKAILVQPAAKLAKALHVLTGHSERRIRTDQGFGAIWNIEEDKTKDGNFKNVPNYNLETVRKLLVDIIADIDKQIAENNKKHKL